MSGVSRLGWSGSGQGRVRGPGSRKAVAVFVGLVLLVSAVPASAQAGGQTELPETMPGIRLLLGHDTADGVELHTVKWDGSERTVLTSGATDTAAAWSPDGRHVAFTRSGTDQDGLYVVTSDGATTTHLGDRGHNPSWAPDSTRVVSSPSTEADPRPLRIDGLDGSSTSVPGTDGGIDPVWSPDGAEIAYIDSDGFGLVVVRPDGSGRRVIAPDPVTAPQWSPDSRQLAYASLPAPESDAGTALVVVNRDGTGARVPAEFPELIQLAFSPDGRHIAFAAAERDDSFNLWRLDLGEGSVVQLTDSDSDDIHPSWTADAGAVAFTRFSDLEDEHATTDVWRTDVSGAGDTQITSTEADILAQFAPGWSIRLAGPDRIHTAVALSTTFAAADTAVIARADDHPDALAGGALAGAVDAPVLLTQRDRLHPAVRGELARLGAEHAYLLGGQAALSAQVETDLADADIDTTRLAGADRFATAATIAAELADVAGSPDRVLVVEGAHADPARGWPDAVSASGLAALTSEPVLLVTRDRIPPATLDALDAADAGQAVIIGGPAAVSPAVATQLGDHVDEVARTAGADRFETSTKVADLAVDAGAEAVHPWLATGLNWPDALTAAPAATHDGGVLVLMHGHDWRGFAHTERWLQNVQDPFVQRAVIVGGPSAISPRMRTLVEQVIGTAP